MRGSGESEVKENKEGYWILQPMLVFLKSQVRALYLADWKTNCWGVLEVAQHKRQQMHTLPKLQRWSRAHASDRGETSVCLPLQIKKFISKTQCSGTDIGLHNRKEQIYLSSPYFGELRDFTTCKRLMEPQLEQNALCISPQCPWTSGLSLQCCCTNFWWGGIGVTIIWSCERRQFIAGSKEGKTVSHNFHSLVPITFKEKDL